MLCEEDVQKKVAKQQVIVESYGHSGERNAVTATIRVANLAFQKTVQVRHTFDGWASSPPPDLSLMWIGSVGTTMDRFDMVIPLPSAGWTGEVEFAIRYEVAEHTYWDNEAGKNYRVNIT